MPGDRIPHSALPPAEMGTAHSTSTFIMTVHYTASEMAILRRSAAQWKGTALPSTIGGKLRLAFKRLQVLRNSAGHVAGFGREGFVLTPKGCGLYTWGEEAQRQAHINA
jgi:hypothetical protein